jgi:hypothetical protein
MRYCGSLCKPMRQLIYHKKHKEEHNGYQHFNLLVAFVFFFVL